jgi:hypothetical protein
VEGRYYLTPFWAGAGAPRYPLGVGRQVIGRSDHAAVVIREPSVSREHAAVEVRGGEVWLEDLGSKHGTFVNSRRVTRTPVHVGDVIVIGLSSVLRLDMEAGTFADAQDVDAGDWPEPPTGPAQSPGREPPSAEMEFIEGSPPTPLRVPNLEAAGRLCLDAIPGIYARLNAVADQIKRAGEKPGAQLSPAVVMQWIEPALARVSRLMTAIMQAPGTPPPLVMMGDVIEDALRRAGAALAEREVAVEREVPLGLGLRAHPGMLADGVASLLVCAATSIPAGSVVSIQASATDDGTQIELRVPLDVELRDDPGPSGGLLRRARSVFESLGGELAIGPGRVQVFISGLNEDEYSPGG